MLRAGLVPGRTAAEPSWLTGETISCGSPPSIRAAVGTLQHFRRTDIGDAGLRRQHGCDHHPTELRARADPTHPAHRVCRTGWPSRSATCGARTGGRGTAPPHSYVVQAEECTDGEAQSQPESTPAVAPPALRAHGWRSSRSAT